MRQVQQPGPPRKPAASSARSRRWPRMPSPTNAPTATRAARRPDPRRRQACGEALAPAAQVWTFAQMHEIAECAGQHQAMLRVMADCGARIGEVFALRRAGLHLAERVLEIRGTRVGGPACSDPPRRRTTTATCRSAPSVWRCCGRCGADRHAVAVPGAGGRPVALLRLAAPRLEAGAQARQHAEEGLGPGRSRARPDPERLPPRAGSVTSVPRASIRPTWRWSPAIRSRRPTRITRTLSAAPSMRSGALSGLRHDLRRYSIRPLLPVFRAEDWELVTRDYEGAKQRAIGLATENPRYQSVWILKINEDNLHVQQEEVEGSETLD